LARRESSSGSSLAAFDPDRLAATLALRFAQPFVGFAFFTDYATRELTLDAVAAELRHIHGIGVKTKEIGNETDLEAMLGEEFRGIWFLLGIEDALPDLGRRLNVERDRLAMQKSLLWIREDRYPELAALAPDLVSIAVATGEKPGLVGSLGSSIELEPELSGLEARYQRTTEEFLRNYQGGTETGIPDEEAHRWATLARLFRDQ
jgi:hypothetical protein